jgi:putative endonuclease
MLKCTTKGINKTYVGYTNDIKQRLNKHNSSKGAKSTKGYNWILIYKKKFSSKSDAMTFEYNLKKNRTQRKIILDNYTK